MKKAKAFIIIALAFLVSTTIAATLTPRAKAQQTAVYTEVSEPSPEVGELFNVSIMASNVENLWAWEVGLQWDPTILEYVSTKPGDFFVSGPLLFGPVVDNVAGITSTPAVGARTGCFDDPATAPLSTLAAFTFRAIGVGSSPLVLTEVALRGQDPTTTTAYPRWSDVNGDGRVDLKDIILVYRPWQKGDYNQTYDLNDDGLNDLTDIAIVTSDFGKGNTHPEWGITHPISDISASIQDGSVTTVPDASPPTTEIHIEGTQSNPPWFTSDATISLDATDLGSGVSQTDYSFDGFTWFAYTSPLVIISDGATTIHYYSIDNTGNVETMKTETIFIDKTAPSITITSPTQHEYLPSEALTVHFSAIDATSGVASTMAVLAPDPAAIYLDPQVSTAYIGQPFTVTVWVADVTDLAGWQIQLSFDPTVLQADSVTIPADNVFTGKITVVPSPQIDNTAGTLAAASVIIASPSFTGTGKLCELHFTPINDGSSALTFLASLPGGLTFLVDSYGTGISPFSAQDGLFVTVPFGEAHDVAVTNIVTFPTTVFAAEQVTTNVDVQNQGAEIETFSVNLYYGAIASMSQTVTLAPFGTTATLTFTWDTTGVPVGSYTIRAEASTVLGELDTQDNTMAYGSVSVMTHVTDGQQIDLSTLAPGKYTLWVEATDFAGNTAENSVIFTVYNTPSGHNVAVELPQGITLYYYKVITGGDTQVTTSTIGPEAPQGFTLGEPPTYYDITTTADYYGTIHIRIPYDETKYADETSLRLLHWDESAQTWVDVTTGLDTVNNIIYGDVPSLSVFAVGESTLGTVSGTVTDEYTNEPIEGVIITMQETASSTTTNAQGTYQFADVLPGSYTIRITLPVGYLTHDSATKIAEVHSLQDTPVDFTLYPSSWSAAKEPRTIGYWKNWDNHYEQGILERISTKNMQSGAQMISDSYSGANMQSFVDDVKASSDLFSDLTVSNLKNYLTITTSSTMKQKAEVQLLASWLDVVSDKLGVDVEVNVTNITGWQTLINDADGIISVNDLLKQVGNYYLSCATLTDQQWEIIKNILDGLNNGRLFMP